MQMENRFRSDGSEETAIGYTHLYPNRWAFSIRIQDSENCGYIEIITAFEIYGTISDIKWIHATYRDY